jgi:peptidoglycan hydrolase CwlO-like protein
LCSSAQSDVDNKKNSIEVLEKKLEQQDKTLETLEAKLKQAQEKVSGMETEVDRKSKEAASMVRAFVFVFDLECLSVNMIHSCVVLY